MRSFACLVVLVGLAGSATAQAIHGREGITLPAPPAVETHPVVDDYFGTKITDNYRWLEDAKSAETRAYIDAQNAYTARYYKQAHMRADVVEDLDALEHVTQSSIPREQAGSYFFSKRLAGEEQYSIYMRHGWTGKDERLIDPAALSRDKNTSVFLSDVSRDGAQLLYGLKQGGADEFVVHVFDIKTHKTLEDALPSARYFSVDFAPDGKSIYYTVWSKKGTLLYQHTIGTRNTRDVLLFGREFHGEDLGEDDLFDSSITDDGHYLMVHIGRGVPAKREDIVFHDLTKPDGTFEILVWGLESRFTSFYAKGAWYVKTDYKSPNGRVLLADPGVLPDVWKTIVPEGSDVIEDFSIVGEKIYIERLKDVKSETTVFSLDGKPEGKVEYEGIGSASAVFGKTTDRYGYYVFSSFIVPPTIYRLDSQTGKRDIFAQPKIPFDSSQYELKQVFYKSKDGTQVPMFIAGKKGLKQDGTARLLMTGYGGFDVSYTPGWSTEYSWWMQQGGWFALPNLRGGQEYGEHWHEQAMFEHKQNVFDDFYAAAEYLIANKYTSPQHVAISGRSNGGLLMGAAMTQRPELFGAIECGYPLLDMLRFQKFLIGSFWTTEYGSAENEKQFPYLLKYSPYHNVKARSDYPAIMFFTGDSDTRVDPLHARKMTALMQANSTGGRPIILHYSLAGGHSAGVSVEQQVQDDADVLTFLWTETAGGK